MQFGQQIKDARIKMNLTQDQVAKKFFVTRQTISNWETEKSYPDINVLNKISDFYHIPLDELLKEDNGVSKYLEKKKIRSLLRFIILILIIIILILSVLMTANQLRYISLGDLKFPIAILYLILLILSSKIDKFNEKNKLEIEYKIGTKGALIFWILMILVATVLMFFRYYLGSAIIIAIMALITLYYYNNSHR